MTAAVAGLAVMLVSLTFGVRVHRRTARRPRRTAHAAVLVAVAMLWLSVNQPMEGPILITVSPKHGLTASDLLSVAGFAVALILVIGRRHGTIRPRRRPAVRPHAADLRGRSQQDP